MHFRPKFHGAMLVVAAALFAAGFAVSPATARVTALGQSPVLAAKSIEGSQVQTVRRRVVRRSRIVRARRIVRYPRSYRYRTVRRSRRVYRRHYARSVPRYYSRRYARRIVRHVPVLVFPYTYRGRAYSRCEYWSDRCVENWGYRTNDYYGCLRYHGC